MAKGELTPGAGALLGPLATLAVAGVLVPVRGTIGNTNVALVLVVVVVAAAAVGGRAAGAATSLGAAVSFNFFHTEPYRSLRVDDTEDVVTVVLLVAVGLAVGELALLGSRAGRVASSRMGGIDSVLRVAEIVRSGAPRPDVTAAVEREVTAVLGLRSCRFEAGLPPSPLPELSHSGRVDVRDRVWAGTGFTLPAEGVTLAVTHAGSILGRLVLDPEPGVAAPIDERKVAVVLADQLGAALAN